MLVSAMMFSSLWQDVWLPYATRLIQETKAPLRVRRTTKYEGPTGVEDLHVKQERRCDAAQQKGNHGISPLSDYQLVSYRTSQLRTLSVRSNPGLVFLPCFLRSM